jgi:hypothetical protein
MSKSLIIFVSRDVVSQNASVVVVKKLRNVGLENLKIVGYLHSENQLYYDSYNIMADYYKSLIGKILILLRLKGKIVFLNVGISQFFPIVFLRLFKRKVQIYTYVDEDVFYLFNGIKKYLLKIIEFLMFFLSTKIVFTSDYYLKMYPFFHKKKIHFKFFVDSDANLKCILVPKNIMKMFFLGSFSFFDREQNMLLLEEILACPNVELHHVGTQGNRKHFLSQRYFNHGYLSDRKCAEIVNFCDICWYPINESEFNMRRTPNKIYEYMRFNKPIIALYSDFLFSIFGNDILYYSKGNFKEKIYSLTTYEFNYNKYKFNMKEIIFE